MVLASCIRVTLAGAFTRLVAGVISYATENRHIDASVIPMVRESAQHFAAPENRRG